MAEGKCGKRGPGHGKGSTGHSESDRKRIDYANYVLLKQKEFLHEGKIVKGE